MVARQATGVAIGGRGVMIEGPVGSGKSALALALVDRGAMLIGDDGLVLEPRDGRLIAGPHPNTRGLIEVRNLGLLPLPVADAVPLCLAILLDEAAPRFIEAPEPLTIADIVLPRIRLRPDSFILPLKAELALAHYGLTA
ncbi:HPr kinase/phosphorylase [Novosphingobium album (ex Liu et al. 2023)]|uniref:Serine kinase n=1 Tax=Novosphingobium album (ex Liu et al. 2023) TaxID=3031130 RepID=A0ABT5WPK3_9SPHN|nr:serine kinase [Novosphingobium album (ex Liu et al. 2023)]MDE8651949.1 serine kinase [Novosphingobium album (ex Liu et al. 2023)]